MERITTIAPAWDKRHPDPDKIYGVYGCELRMILKGTRGAVQFVLQTNWQLPHVEAGQISRLCEYSSSQVAERMRSTFLPLPADKGYHSPTPMYDGQTAMPNCPYLDGKPCYCDGSALNAERTYLTLREKGSDGVWAELEEYYKQLFGELV